MGNLRSLPATAIAVLLFAASAALASSPVPTPPAPPSPPPAPAAPRAPAAPAAPSAPGPPPAGEVFAFHEAFPLPTVPVVIAGHGPYLFILDTGAAATLIDEALAAELALESRGKQQVVSPLGSGAQELPVVAMTDVSLGSLGVPDFEATVFDLRGLLGGGNAADVPRGVLSPNDVGDRLVVLDLGGRTARITPGQLPEPDGVSVFGYDGPLPEIPVQIGDHRFRVHLDTGSPGGVSLPLSVAKSLPLQGEPAVVGHARTVDSEVKILGATLNGAARVGGVELANPRIEFLDGAPVGNVGGAFLSNHILTIDARRHRVRLSATEAAVSAAGPDERAAPRVMVVSKGHKRYGIRFAGGIDGSPIRVAGVDEGSPAATAGLRSGDLIERMNGVPVAELETADRIAALRGNPLELGVQRDGEVLELSMSLD